jgi:DNA (cytosine-5)-methyltransferase 1
MTKVLNLYAGLGGNRKLWTEVQVTAVESEPKIAAVYQRLNPADTVIVGDAHAYLLENLERFDFVWSSPPCQTHSKMNKATRHKLNRYPDMRLYEEIIYLQHNASCKWVVENVKPYYAPLLPAKEMGRHLVWCNFAVEACEIPTPPDFINKCTVAGKRALMEWLGIHYDENIYYAGNHCPAQILRNCVHPLLGKHILDAARMPNDEVSDGV